MSPFKPYLMDKDKHMILRDFPAFYWFQFDAFFNFTPQYFITHFDSLLHSQVFHSSLQIISQDIFSDDLAGQLN